MEETIVSDTRIEVTKDEKVYMINLFEDEVKEFILEKDGSKIVSVEIKKL